MSFGKGTEFIPVRDFVSTPRRSIRLRFVISRLTPPLQPQVNGIATDLKQLSGFALLYAIQLNRFDDFLTQVVAVGLCH